MAVVSFGSWALGCAVFVLESLLIGGHWSTNLRSGLLDLSSAVLLVQPVLMVGALWASQRFFAARQLAMTTEGFAGLTLVMGLLTWCVFGVVLLNGLTVLMGVIVYLFTGYFAFAYCLAVVVGLRRVRG